MTSEDADLQNAMELLNISLDHNETDTSQEDFEDDEDDEDDYEECKAPDKTSEEDKGNLAQTRNDGKEKAVNPYNCKVDVSLDDSDAIKKEFQDWERPKIPDGALLYSSSVLQEQPEEFQFFLIDSKSTISSDKHPGIQLNPCMKDLPLHNVIRLFGVARIPEVQYNTASICCNVHGFVPYFFAVPVGKSGTYKVRWSSITEDRFVRLLDERVKQEIVQDLLSVEYHNFIKTSPCVLKLEVLKTADVKDKIYHFHETRYERNAENKILKIYCSLPRFVWKAQRVLDDLLFENCQFQCYETNINNNIRFLTDQNLPGCSWLQLSLGNYFQRTDTETPHKESYCQIEVDVHYSNISVLPEDHWHYLVSPSLRILSFDIEVMVSPEDLTSPKQGSRQVIQIGSVLSNYNGMTDKNGLIGKTVFVLGTCDLIPDVRTIQFYVKEHPEVTMEDYLEEAESIMLGAWRDFVVRMDPDIIMGYNIKKFDLPYLIDRANILTTLSAKRLPYLGRMKKLKSQIRPILNSLKKVHPYDECNVDIQGRIIMDMYPMLVRHDRRNFGRGQFKLANVAKRFLNKSEEKQDVHYTEIESLQHGTSVTRKRLAEYCVQDSMIPLLLLHEPVPCRTEVVGFLDLYVKKSLLGGNLLRYLFNKSMTYNDYFKHIRVQKNAGNVRYNPDTPSPSKKYDTTAAARDSSSPSTSKSCFKKLFPE